MKLLTSISKRSLWRYVNIKINRTVHYSHVLSVIAILFEELASDLDKGAEIKIFNFGTLFLKKTKPRRYHNVRYMCVMQSGSNKILRFIPSTKFRNKICNLIDLDKTFGD